MQIIKDSIPPLLPDNTYIAIDSEWFGMETARLHRPTTGKFACLTLCYREEEVYLIQNPDIVQPALERIDNCVWLIHNAKFDLTHLRRLATIKPRTRLIDTMMMDRILWNGYYERFGLEFLARRYLKIYLDKSLQEKWQTSSEMSQELIDYSVSDADVLLRVWNEQRKHITKADMKVYKEIDLPALWAVLDFRGFRLDVDGWRALASDNKEEALRLEEQLDFNPRSSQQIVTKLKSRGFKGLPNSQAETLEKFINKYPNSEAAEQAEIVLRCKEVSTFSSKYGTGWLDDFLEDFPDGSQGFLADFIVTGAETGRMSCRKPPLHQIPSRATKIYREKFLARPGCKLVIADYSQQEVVICAYITQDTNLMKICNSDDDIYILMAKMMYNKDIDRKDPLRARMKSVVLGIDYGMTEYGLSAKENISKKEAAEVIYLFRQKFPQVARYLDATEKEKTLVYTVTGRKFYLNLYSNQCYRNALNAPIQGTAADITKKALAALHKGWKWDCEFGVVNIIHDEFVLDVPEKYVEEVKEFVKETMISVANSVCPGMKFKVDVSVADTWAGKA